MKPEPIRQAAILYVETRDRVRALRKSLKHCERRVYDSDIVGDERGNPIEPVIANRNDDNEFCSRVQEWHQTSEGPYPEPLPPAKWCQSCRDNIPTVEALKSARKATGARAATLFRMCRKAATP